MQPSTWNDTNQHWISQFLLKGFGIRKKASSVYELDKETKVVAVRKVSEAASKPRVLTERDDEVMRGIESRTAVVIDVIRKGHLDRIDEDGRQAVDRLVLAMTLNDPYHGIDVETTRAKAIAEVVSELSEAVSRYGGTLDEPDFSDYMDQRLTYDLLSGFVDSKTQQIGLALRLMGLRAFTPPEGEFFIIGDSPVLVVRGVVNGETNLLNPGSQVILPISSRCILVYTWATEMNVIGVGGTLDREQVRSLNSDYYRGTKCRYVYARNEETLRRSQLLPLKWTERERSNDVSSGWALTQHLRQFMQRRQAVQDVVQSMTFDYGARELVDTAITQSGHGAIQENNGHDLGTASNGTQSRFPGNVGQAESPAGEFLAQALLRLRCEN